MLPIGTRRHLTVVLKGTISLALIVFVARKVDVSALGLQLASIKPGLLALGAVLILLQTIVGAIRWQAIMVAQDDYIDLLTTIGIYYIGVFFTTCTPGSVLGDVVRTWRAHQSGVAFSSAVSSVIIDRLAVAAVLAIASVAIVPLLPQSIPTLFPGILAISTIVIGFLLVVAAVIAAIQLLPKLQRYKAIQKIRGFFARELRLVLRPRSVTWVLFLCAGSQAVLCIAMYVLALAVNIHVGYVEFLLLMPPVVLATMLPISIAGWGVRETALVFVLGLVGVAPERALLLSVLIGILAVVISLPGGVLWLLLPSAPVEQNLEELGATTTAETL